MSTTLHLPDDLVEDIQLRAAREGRGVDETVAELLRAGLAASATTMTQEPTDISMLERRRSIAEKFLTGEWGVELAAFEEERAAERKRSESREQGWSD